MKKKTFCAYYQSWADISNAQYTELCSTGWHPMRIIPGYGLCGLDLTKIYTYDMILKIGPNGCEERYTFETLAQACTAIATWSGEGRPGEEWINHYGGPEGRIRNMKHPINKNYIGHECE